jgi:hypothetical protein
MLVVLIHVITTFIIFQIGSLFKLKTESTEKEKVNLRLYLGRRFYGE